LNAAVETRYAILWTLPVASGPCAIGSNMTSISNSSPGWIVVVGQSIFECMLSVFDFDPSGSSTYALVHMHDVLRPKSVSGSSPVFLKSKLFLTTPPWMSMSPKSYERPSSGVISPEVSVD